MKWPLNDSSFTFLDKIKICLFFLNSKNRWTQDKYVKKIEVKMAKLLGYKYSVFCSSGSTANTVIAMNLKDTLNDENRKVVVLPAVTWQTSCSPFIREGFDPHFIDISLDNFGMDLDILDKYLQENHLKVAAVFPTGLLGYNLNYLKLIEIREKYPDIKFYIDQCENTFGSRAEQLGSSYSSFFTSTTSTYFGHQIQSVEGGFIFTNSVKEYHRFLMYRNHGMTRGLDSLAFPCQHGSDDTKEYKRSISNPNVDERFDFYLFGSNFRNTDINAFIGLLDLNRFNKSVAWRRYLSKIFLESLNSSYLNWYCGDILFCLPIVLKDEDCLGKIERIKIYCERNGIETRPIISGFLGFQTAYANKYKFDGKDFKKLTNSITSFSLTLLFKPT